MQKTARTGIARRDDKMSRNHSFEATSAQRKVSKKQSNAKRRKRDKSLRGQ